MFLEQLLPETTLKGMQFIRKHGKHLGRVALVMVNQPIKPARYNVITLKYVEPIPNGGPERDLQEIMPSYPQKLGS